jgi:hypothetical protein
VGPIDGRRCCDCDQHKPADEFYRYKSGGLYTRCKRCHYAYTQRWRAANRDKIRQLDRERYSARYAHKRRGRKHLAKYGLTPEGYTALMERQGGVCPICLEPLIEHAGPIGDRAAGANWTLPSVDHCHETGKVRGILHRRCNLAIEFLLPDDAVARARQYLRTAGEPNANVDHPRHPPEGEPDPGRDAGC